MKFNIPKRSKIIFFDVVDDIILNIFKNQEVNIINLRLLKKEANIFIILRILISYRLLRILINEGIIIAYTSSFIEYSKASKVITCVDNNTRFYCLKKYFRKVKFIAIQNGSRHVFMDLFGSPDLKKNLLCDEILVFGNSIKKKYKEHILSNVHCVGCFRNNNFSIFKIKKKKTILFLSQFRNFPEEKKMQHFDKTFLTWKQLNLNLYKLLPNLLKYCKVNNLKLGVLSSTGSHEEYQYFKRFFGRNYQWNFYKAKDRKQSYKILDMSEIVVNVWSTMGMESLSRGNKTCFFRQPDFGFNDRHFGWPKKYINNDIFYSNNCDYKTVSKILNNMLLIKDNNWREIVLKYSKDNLIYNFQNNKLVNLIKG